MAERQITLDEAERIGRALMPAFAEVVSDKIDELEEKLERKYEARFVRLEAEVGAMKGFRTRIAIVYAGFSALAVLVWGAASEWVKAKLLQKP